jgi:hypothetical protein
VEPAVGFDPADIACPEPSSGQKRRFVGAVGKVAHHDLRAFDQDLAFGAVGHVGGAIEIDNSHLGVGEGNSGGVETAPVGVLDRVAVQPDRLGGAIGADPAQTAALADPVGNVC